MSDGQAAVGGPERAEEPKRGEALEVADKLNAFVAKVAPIALGAVTTVQLLRKKHNPRIGTESTLREPGRCISVVTTAALPWLTGTSVNPLLRAAYLSRNHAITVYLVVPWLNAKDQRTVFPNGLTFETHEDQEAYIRSWLGQRISFAANFEIIFYGGRYDKAYGSVMPRGKGDIVGCMPPGKCDVAVLEEPEHLNWFNSGGLWTDAFNHVVGIAHTNYIAYALQDRGVLQARFLSVLNRLMVSLHCHKVIKLSNAVQTLPRQSTCFVHGVGEPFLRVGDERRSAEAVGRKYFSKGAYFIGKAIWGKGYHELLDLAHFYSTESGQGKLSLDVFGSGPDLEAIKAKASRLQLDTSFHGSKDHLDPSLHAYRCFVNPSLSDVVATTTAEALAMGKWVVVAVHPENEFFSSFANCLQYSSPAEFVQCMNRALENDPAALTEEERTALTWEAATERFLDSAVIGPKEWPKLPARVRDHVFGVTFQGALEVVKVFQLVLNTVTEKVGDIAQNNPLRRRSRGRRFVL